MAITLTSFPSSKDDVINATDFSSFYCAAQIVRNGEGSQLYDLRVQAAFQSKIAAVHAFYNHPPYEALFFVPFTYLSYRTAFFVWTFINLALVSASAYIIYRSTSVCRALEQYTRIPVDMGLVLVIFLTFAPVTTCLLLGENSLLTLLIYTLAFANFRRGSMFVSGCVLALALFKFQLVLPLAFILLLRRKWSFLAGLSLSGGLLVLLSMAVSGTQVLSEYPRFLLFESSHSDLARFEPEFMPNLRGFVSWAASGVLTQRTLTMVTAGLSLLLLWWVARKWREDRMELSFAVGTLAVLLVSFHLYNYDLALLLLPVCILCDELARSNMLRGNAPTTVALLVLFIHPIHRLLLLHRLYTVMSLPVFVLLLSALKVARGASKAVLAYEPIHP